MAVPNLQIHDEGALRWDPTEVTVPSVPAIAPSDDPMSLMIAAVMPEIPTEVSEKVAATRAREGEFAAKLNAARRAYRSADDTGQQDIEAANEAIAPSGAGLGAPNARTERPRWPIRATRRAAGNADADGRRGTRCTASCNSRGAGGGRPGVTASSVNGRKSGRCRSGFRATTSRTW